MTPGRKVFIPNVGFHAYDDAKRFGELVAITRANVDLSATDRLEGHIKEALEESHPDDYVLLSGAPLLNVLVAGIFFSLHGSVRLLQWDGVLRQYYLRTTEFDGKEPGF